MQNSSQSSARRIEAPSRGASSIRAFVPSLIAGAFLAAATCAAAEGQLRLGIVGMDTSHAPAFLKNYNDPASPDYVAGAKIIAGFKGGSPDVEWSRTRVDRFTRQAVESYGVKLYDSVEELARNVDGILILSVDGRTHLDQFRRTLAAKKPVFIDKPFAGTLRDGIEIMRLSKTSGVPCYSASSIRYTLDTPGPRLRDIGQVVSAYSFSPAELEPHHPDLFWYAVHAVEALYQVLGRGCVQVTRVHTEKTDIVTGVWSDGRIGIVQGNRNSTAPKYGITVLGSKGMLHGGEKHSYKPLAEAVMKFLQTGVSPVPLEETVEALAFMEAADESKRRGGAPVRLDEVYKAAGGER